MAKKCLLLILDGLGDRAHPELKGLTPLQAASTPNLDRIAARGSAGIYHPGTPGRAFPSEKAHFSLFGYSQAEFPGRGLLEALGHELSPGPQEVCLLAHLAGVSVQRGCFFLEQENPPEPQQEELQQILDSLPHPDHPEMGIKFHPTRGSSGILILSGPVSPFFTDTNPMQDRVFLPEPAPWEGLPSGEREWAGETASALKSYLLRVHQSLQEHPVNRQRSSRGLAPLNALITQRPGKMVQAPPFPERFGLRGATIASGAVYRGLAFFLGLDYYKASDSGDPGADLAERTRSGLELLRDYDLVHVHTKAPDTAAHSKSPQRKREVITALDRALESLPPELILDRDLLLAVTADHSTPSSGPLIHSGEPVPLALLSRDTRRDQVQRFEEAGCAAGALGLLRQRELMYTILDGLNRSKLTGTRDTPQDLPYWPSKRDPFRIA